ncbi:helix-turn-helix transcriptional regulator [Ornithinicoccus hortensis]|uniref:Putative ArsR family transcriptional regulator n=1 Tax=Ornithinicoccus hortensis TaxID=82346 RepID=A0A542YMP0_9MICO|nr:helix-turn-helix domain-containing protein [Ornithinicoccus hortensis]TQL49234.1 putative ArsR family transcriptional regulator [Ornithinicoccus hortensis]
MSTTGSRQGISLLRSDVRRRLVDHLAGLPEEADGPAGGGRTRGQGLTATELAEVVGLHVTTVRFHVDLLVGAGLLVARDDEPHGAGRPRKRYAVPWATPRAAEPATHRAYAALAEVLGLTVDGAPVPGETLEGAARDWVREQVAAATPGTGGRPTPARTPGAWLGKVGTVLDLLDGWGHQPDLRTRSGAREVDIVLHDCPFLDLAQGTPETVCGVHRGLLRGALDELGEESVEVDLQPLVTGRTCVAHLTVPAQFADRGETT